MIRVKFVCLVVFHETYVFQFYKLESEHSVPEPENTKSALHMFTSPSEKIMQLPLEVFCNYALTLINYTPLACIPPHVSIVAE